MQLSRIAIMLAVLVSTARADNFELRPPELTLRAGLHHTHVTKDDGEPDGFGPRVELETTSARIRVTRRRACRTA